MARCYGTRRTITGPLTGTSGLTTSATIGNLEVSLFVKNLNNNQTVLQRPNVDAFYEGYYLRPRTIGGSVQYKFGGE